MYRHLRMRDRAQEALAARHVHTPHLGILGVHGRRPAVEALDRPSVELHQDVVEVFGDQIDEGGPGVERLAVGERAALQDCFSGERHVAAAGVGERSHVRSGIGGGLLRGGLVHLLARARHRVRSTGVRRRCHRGDVGGHQENESG